MSEIELMKWVFKYRKTKCKTALTTRSKSKKKKKVKTRRNEIIIDDESQICIGLCDEEGMFV